MLTIAHEPMSGVFDKFHVGGLPFPAVFHRFTAPDEGDPHDHPFRFRSTILSGGYLERVFALDGLSFEVERRVGDTFEIDAGHIHRIVQLLDGECWTLMLPLGPAERKSGFYDFRPDGAYHRPWDRAEFQRLLH